MSELPQGWALADVNETLLPFENGQTLRQGWSPQCESFPAPNVDRWGVLKTTAIQDGEFQPEQNKALPTSLDPDPTLEIEAGDLLLTCAGPRSRCGVVCLVRKTRPRLMASGKMYRFKTEPRVALPVYLEVFLRFHETKKRIDELKTGISDSGLNLTLDRFKTLRVPLPPVPEQRRIVAKIEELFSELDEGMENLKKARAQLEVYRQSLLKHAFEGKLTAAWREANQAKLEPAEQLLARLRPTGFVSVKAKDVASLPELPSGWSYTYLTNLGELARGKSKHRPRDAEFLFGGPYPFIQTGEVKAAGRVIRNFENTYSEAGLAQSRLWPKGTLCITIAANIAQTAFLGFDACFPDSVVGFTAFGGVVESEFVDLFIRGVRTRIEAYAPATAQKNINLTTLENLVVPLAPSQEQKELIACLSAHLSAIDQTASDLATNLQKAEALRQAILKKAFAGELVPQDPANEPASVLLERIRAERAAKAKEAKPVRVSKRARAISA
jgi:restriction endonuclease S subunit